MNTIGEKIHSGNLELKNKNFNKGEINIKDVLQWLKIKDIYH